jgi:hypothetical protein
MKKIMFTLFALILISGAVFAGGGQDAGNRQEAQTIAMIIRE